MTKNTGHFTVAAVTPDGALYQAGLSGAARGRRHYAAYEVDAEGETHVRAGSGFPLPSADREEFAGRFRAWAEGRGYEILGAGGTP
jgi:hypothetical protein